MRQSVTIEKLRRAPPSVLSGKALPAGLSWLAVLGLFLAERLTVGRIPQTGQLALGALAAVFPLVLAALAGAVLVGKSGAKEASRLLSLGKQEEAEQMLGSSFCLLIFCGLLLTAGFQLVGAELLQLAGAGKESLPLALDYLNTYSLGLVFVLLTWGLNAFLTAQGRLWESAAALLAAAATALFLTPLLTLRFGLGLPGAALAGLVAHGISALLMTLALAVKKTSLGLRIASLIPGIKTFKIGLHQGLSAFLLLLGEGLIFALLNRRLFRLEGELGLAVLTVLTGVLALFLLPLMGLAKGAKPLLQARFAKDDTEHVKRTAGLLILLSLGFSVVLWAAVQLRPQTFFRLFGGEERLADFGLPLLRLFSAGACLLGLQTALRQVLSAVGAERNLPAAVPPRSRILMLIFIFVLPGLSGRFSKTALILLAQPLADFFAAAFALALFLRGFHRALEGGAVYAERRQGRLFRLLRLVIALFTPRMETVWEEPFSGAPSVFVCNHDRAFGPIAMCVHFPLCREIRPWINAQVLSPRETPQYVREDYWWNPDKWTAPIFDYSLAYLMALLIPPILRGADSVPVYHDAGVMATLRASVKTLSDGKHLLLFPERPTGYHQYDTEIFDGFVSVGRLYYKRSRERVHFYPAFVDWESKKITVGKPLVYDPSVDHTIQAPRTAKAIEAYFAARTEDLKSGSEAFPKTNQGANDI